MTVELFVASFGHRYSDPCAVAVGLARDAIADMIERSMEFERDTGVTFPDSLHP